jgi:mannose-6-phosphate isomerase
MTVDASWVRPFLSRLVERWLAGARQDSGLFYPHLDRQWNRIPGRECTLVSQSRLVYNFSRAYEIGLGDEYAAAARDGLAALRSYFGLTNGQYRWSCSHNGEPRDDKRDSYGHAFVILAFATAARVFEDDSCRDDARAVWRFVDSQMRDDVGGIVRTYGERTDTRSQNPMMHLFEALLVLGSLRECGDVIADALGILSFLEARMRSGCIPEWYDASWRPLEAGPRAGFDVGHQFEWAFLHSEAHALTSDDALVTDALRLLEFGCRVGFNDEGAVVSPVDPAGVAGKARIGWWEQCEALRALWRHITRHGRADLETSLDRCMQYFRTHIVDDDYGGCFSSPDHTGGKGSAWKCGYHTVNLCLELLACE